MTNEMNLAEVMTIAMLDMAEVNEEDWGKEITEDTIIDAGVGAGIQFIVDNQRSDISPSILMGMAVEIYENIF